MRLHIRTTLVFPEGASGNFLIGLAGAGWSGPQDDSNEYSSDQCFWPNMDKARYSVNCDLIYQLARGIESRYASEPLPQFACSHYAPAITAQVFDLTTDELIIIRPSSPHMWIPQALYWYKTFFSQDIHYKPKMIANVLNGNRYQGIVNSSEYRSVMAKISAKTGVNLMSTLISWEYFLDCKARELDPLSMENWSAHLSASWETQLLDDGFNGTRHYHDIDWCRRISYSVTELDYLQLMWQLQLPQQGAFSGLDRSEMLSYSQRNCELLSLIITLLPESYHPMMERELAQLVDHLSAAAAAVK